MAELLDKGFTVAIQRETIHPVGAIRVSFYKDYWEAAKKTTLRLWMSVAIDSMNDLEWAVAQMIDKFHDHPRYNATPIQRPSFVQPK